MNYTMRRPCSSCPFTRTGLRLSPARARELGGQIVGMNGEPGRATFVCHNTADKNNESYFVACEDSQHCAGALIFAEKQNAPTQMMRIVERLGLYDRTKLDMQADVFDNLAEMVKANRRGSR